ncbi:hypothetical protein ACFWNH_29000 [Rhodococcus qingshengii]|uniref:hypothetical protein n=1 Tax=Rhodococcus qingshengii TaxID=334542 RepID=UPI0036638071
MNFLEYITTGELRKDAPDRGDYINALALTPVVGLGFIIFQLIIPFDSTVGFVAIGAVGGAAFGLTYLYAAYKIHNRRR